MSQIKWPEDLTGFSGKTFGIGPQIGEENVADQPALAAVTGARKAAADYLIRLTSGRNQTANGDFGTDLVRNLASGYVSSESDLQAEFRFANRRVLESIPSNRAADERVVSASLESSSISENEASLRIRLELASGQIQQLLAALPYPVS